MTAAQERPTSRWLSHVPELPPLEGPAGVAERLILHLHYGVDWSGWLGSYRERYWDDVLPDRLLVATYRSGTLPRWWSEAATELDSSPRTAAARREVAALLVEPALPVLEVVRAETTALTLRVRIVAEAVREARPARWSEGEEPA